MFLQFRLMTRPVMTSLIFLLSRLLPSFLQQLSTQAGRLGNWLGVSPCGSRPSPSSRKSGCSIRLELWRTSHLITWQPSASTDSSTSSTGSTDGRLMASTAGLRFSVAPSRPVFTATSCTTIWSLWRKARASLSCLFDLFRMNLGKCQKWIQNQQLINHWIQISL